MGSTQSSNRSKSRSLSSDESDLPKILVLGCMNSGKSTVCRHLVRQGRKTPDKILRYYTHPVQHNIFLLWKEVMVLCRKYDIDISKFKDDEKMLNEFRHKEVMSDKVIDVLKRISRSGILEQCQMKSRNLRLRSNYEYFVQNTDRMLEDSYVPTESDIIHSYTPTIGMAENIVSFDYYKYRLIELPGHHIYRRRWQQFFKNTDAVMFIVDISELADSEFYHGHLKMKSWQIFMETHKNPLISQLPLILLFTKIDALYRSQHLIEFTKLQTILNSPNASSVKEITQQYISKFINSEDVKIPKDRIFSHMVSLVEEDGERDLVNYISSVLNNNIENFSPE